MRWCHIWKDRDIWYRVVKYGIIHHWIHASNICSPRKYYHCSKGYICKMYAGVYDIYEFLMSATRMMCISETIGNHKYGIACYKFRSIPVICHRVISHKVN